MLRVASLPVWGVRHVAFCSASFRVSTGKTWVCSGLSKYRGVRHQYQDITFRKVTPSPGATVGTWRNGPWKDSPPILKFYVHCLESLPEAMVQALFASTINKAYTKPNPSNSATQCDQQQTLHSLRLWAIGPHSWGSVLSRQGGFSRARISTNVSTLLRLLQACCIGLSTILLYDTIPYVLYNAMPWYALVGYTILYYNTILGSHVPTIPIDKPRGFIRS